MRHRTIKWIICLFIFFLNSNIVKGLKCFVCSPIYSQSQVANSIAKNITILTCDNFNENDNRYIADCKHTHRSTCHTEINGTQILRSCDGLNVTNSCVDANNVKYCYCFGNLCNNHIVDSSANIPLSDDEDDSDDSKIDGSGDFFALPESTEKSRELHVTTEYIPPLLTTVTTPILAASNTSNSHHISCCLYFLYVIFFTVYFKKIVFLLIK